MPTTVNEQTLDAVNAVNAKLGMEMDSIGAAGVATQNQVSLQQRINELAAEGLAANLALSRQATANQLAFSQAVTARTVRMVMDLSAEQAAAFGTELGSQIHDKLASIEAVLSAGQQQEKTAITTPPQTGTGGAFGSDAGSALMQQIVNQLAILEAELTAIKAKLGT
jgi:hypothetical protein